MAKVRLQKILARAGIASRRAAEDLIVKGRVRIGTKVVTELGTKADPRQEAIFVNGKRIKAEDLIYVLLHKPRGVVCTMKDPEGRKTVAELLVGVPSRIVPVGRLDYETSGVLLLTNDGEFAAAMAHPRHKAEKIYVAKVKGIVDEPALERFGKSIEIDGKRTQPAWVQLLRHEEGDKSWIEVKLREGKNRHIHHLGEYAGFPVMRLARVSFAGLTAEGLRPGQWRYLSVKELTAFKRSYGFPQTIHAPPVTDRTEQGRVYRADPVAAERAEVIRRRLEKEGAPARGRTRGGPRHDGERPAGREAPRGARSDDPRRNREAPRGGPSTDARRGREAPRGGPSTDARRGREAPRGGPSTDARRGREAPRAPARGRR